MTQAASNNRVGSFPDLRVLPPLLLDDAVDDPEWQLEDDLSADELAAEAAASDAAWEALERVLSAGQAALDAAEVSASADVAPADVAPADSVEALRAARLAADVPLAAPGVSLGLARSCLAGPLDALEQALDTVDAADASGSRVDTERLLRLTERARGLALREVAEMDALGTHTSPTGPKSSTHGWLTGTLQASDGAARSTVRTAIDLRDRLPVLEEALREGRITVEAAKAVLSGVRGLDAETVADSQDDLLALAQLLDPVAVHKRLRDMAIAVNDKLAKAAERKARERAGFNLHQVGDHYVGAGYHDAETGATLATFLALEVARYRRDGDARSKAQLQEQALLDLALRGLDERSDAGSEADDVHRTRSHLLVGCTAEHLDAAASTPDGTPVPAEQLSFTDALHQALHGTAAGTSSTPDTPSSPHSDPHSDPHPTGSAGEPGSPLLSPTLINSSTALSRDALRRLACDSLVQLVLLRDGAPARLDPLNVGRAARTINAQLFVALVVRDRHCVVQGCTQPPAVCEGHHVQHWLDGGLTVMANLVLLCRQHHHDHHDRGRDLPHRDGRRWLTQRGWRWFTAQGWSETDPDLALSSGQDPGAG